MSVSLLRVLSQTTNLAAFARIGWSVVAGQGATTEQPVLPGPLVEATVPPRSPALVRDYIRWCGGDGRAWGDRLPPHFFPQWVMAPMGCNLGPPTSRARATIISVIARVSLTGRVFGITHT